MIRPKKRGRKKKKKGPNKAILFLIFSGTFILCFYISSFIIANYIPNVELPVITNEEQEVATVSSNDFRQRIDPRLQQIEKSANLPVRMQRKVHKHIKQKKVEAKVNNNKSTSSNKYNSGTDNEFMPDEIIFNGVGQKVQTPLSQQFTNKRRAYSSTPLPPRPRTVIENQDNVGSKKKMDITAPPLPSASIVKLYVGEFSNPRDAKRLSDELTHSSLNITPFIKEINGKYSLQIGTFTSKKQAKDIAKKLKRRKLKPKFVKENIFSY